MAGSRSTSKQVPKSPEAKIIDSEEDMPNDARAVLEILRSMGIERCEAVVLNQLAEFMTRYTTEVLEDARVFADHAAKTDVELDDVQLSLHAKTSEEYPQQPSVDELIKEAEIFNSIPFPEIDDQQVLPLPPRSELFITPNWQVEVAQDEVPEPVAETPSDSEGAFGEFEDPLTGGSPEVTTNGARFDEDAARGVRSNEDEFMAGISPEVGEEQLNVRGSGRPESSEGKDHGGRSSLERISPRNGHGYGESPQMNGYGTESPEKEDEEGGGMEMELDEELEDVEEVEEEEEEEEIEEMAEEEGDEEAQELEEFVEHRNGIIQNFDGRDQESGENMSDYDSED